MWVPCMRQGPRLQVPQQIQQHWTKSALYVLYLAGGLTAPRSMLGSNLQVLPAREQFSLSHCASLQIYTFEAVHV